MEKHFIELGTYDGKTLKRVGNVHPDYIRYGFEPIEKFYKLAEKNNPKAKIYNKCAWIKESEKILYLGNGQGSTLFKSKTTDEVGEHGQISVDCIDFPKWIKEKFNKSDYIILSMNVEGSEYPIIEKMISNGTISYIDELYCKWHWHKIKTISKQRHNKLFRKLKHLVKYRKRRELWRGN